MINAKFLSAQITPDLCSGIFGVPDSLLAELCRELESVVGIPNVTACNEGAAVGLAIGSYLASGKPALVYMQNSGLGNAVNPLLSLADREVYGIPMVLLIGWRGEPGVIDEPQHMKQGRVTKNLLEVLGVPHEILDGKDYESAESLHAAFRLAIETNGPVALLVKKGSFQKTQTAPVERLELRDQLMTRESAMKIVHEFAKSEDKIVATTGMLSRELEEHQNSLTSSNLPGTFLVIGGMGHASSIGLGIALADPRVRVWCFDGDGALLMHLGTLPVTANSRPSDFIHIVFHNGAHDSVGGQETPLQSSDIAAMALAAGYTAAMTCRSQEEISQCLSQYLTTRGPRLLVIKVAKGYRANLGRPKMSPRSAKKKLMSTFSAE